MQQLQPLNTDEFEFIQRQYRSESKIYMRTMNVLLVLGTLAPMAFCVILIALSNGDIAMLALYNVYFVGLVFMMFFVGMIAFVSYRIKLRAYHRDLKARDKICEQTSIKQKKYMKLNDTYHFYLSSPTLYTIEVSAADYHKYQLGDEINIEYAQYSKEYFGYY